MTEKNETTLFKTCMNYNSFDTLDNAKLLALIIKPGLKFEKALNISNEILSYFESNNSLNFLLDINYKELQKIKGIGKLRALRILAVVEIAKRIYSYQCNNYKIKNNKDVVKLFSDLKYEKREFLKIVILNNKNNVLRIKTIAIGTCNSVYTDPKHILAEVVKLEAPKFILIHNHPSGDPTPSNEDFLITKKVKGCSNILNIELLDHIIIAQNNYISIINWEI